MSVWYDSGLVESGVLAQEDDSEGDQFLDALARGDAAAMGQAYRQHHVQVRAFAQRLVGDEATAEDLVHEVFVTLPAAVRNFRGDSSLRTFLIAIAVNHAKHHVRSAARRRAAMTRLAEEPRPSYRAADEGAVRAQLADALARALDAIPVEQRVVFVLCEVEDRPSREVADIVRAPEATVRARLQLAKKKLRAILEEVR